MDEVTRLALELAWKEGYDLGYTDGGWQEYTPGANPYSKKES